MATYNPRAGMPPRKKTEAPLGEALPDDLAKAFFEPDTLAQLASPEGLDGNALRGWLLGYMDSIGDQLPDLAQWRRIREEVGRSVAVKEAVKETGVPVKPMDQTVPSHNHYWGVDWGNWTSGGTYQYAVGIGADGQLYHLDSQGNRLNLCGND